MALVAVGGGVVRTSADALRSMLRYTWKLLEHDTPPVWRDEQSEWEIRPWGMEGAFKFPFARVAAITPTQHTGSAVIRESARTFALHLYPVPLGSPEDSIMEVERVEELLTVAFETGFMYIDQPDPVDSSTWLEVRSAPRRVPLYDYAGVPLDGPNSVSYARAPHDFLRVTECPINRIVDPEDDRYWLVTAEPRVTWRRRGRVPVDGPLVKEVRVEIDTV